MKAAAAAPRLGGARAVWAAAAIAGGLLVGRGDGLRRRTGEPLGRRLVAPALSDHGRGRAHLRGARAIRLRGSAGGRVSRRGVSILDGAARFFFRRAAAAAARRRSDGGRRRPAQDAAAPADREVEARRPAAPPRSRRHGRPLRRRLTDLGIPREAHRVYGYRQALHCVVLWSFPLAKAASTNGAGAGQPPTIAAAA